MYHWSSRSVPTSKCTSRTAQSWTAEGRGVWSQMLLRAGAAVWSLARGVFRVHVLNNLIPSRSCSALSESSSGLQLATDASGPTEPHTNRPKGRDSEDTAAGAAAGAAVGSARGSAACPSREFGCCSLNCRMIFHCSLCACMGPTMASRTPADSSARRCSRSSADDNDAASTPKQLPITPRSCTHARSKKQKSEATKRKASKPVSRLV